MLQSPNMAETVDYELLGGRGEAAAVDIQRIYRGHSIRRTKPAHSGTGRPAGGEGVADSSATATVTIADDERQTAAATAIQKRARGRLARKRLAEGAHASSHGGVAGQNSAKVAGSGPSEVEQAAAATVLQKHARGRATRKKLASSEAVQPVPSEAVTNDVAAEAAAINIQRHMRGHLVRKESRRQNDAAVTIQKHARGIKVRVIGPSSLADGDDDTTWTGSANSLNDWGDVDALSEVGAVDQPGSARTLPSEHIVAANDEDSRLAATMIQRHVRGKQTRRALALQRQRADAKAGLLDSDGLVAVDGFLGSSNLDSTAGDGSDIAAAAMMELVDDHATHSSPASRRQAEVAERHLQARGLPHITEGGSFTDTDGTMSMPGSLAEFERSALTVQRSFRGYQGRKRFSKLKLRDTSARNIQRVGRGHIARQELRGGRNPHGVSADSTLDTQAARIQSVYRGRAERRRMQEMQDSATTIQRIYRGHAVRRSPPVPPGDAAAVVSSHQSPEEQSQLAGLSSDLLRLVKRMVDDKVGTATTQPYGVRCAHHVLPCRLPRNCLHETRSSGVCVLKLTR